MMALNSKKYAVLVLVVLALVVYFIVTDFQAFKKLTGINPPVLTQLPPAGESDLATPGNVSMAVFAKELNNPRVMAFDSRGRILVSETKAGRVSILEDSDKDGKADSRKILIDGLRSPHGLAFYNDASAKADYLFIAETHQVNRYPYDAVAGQLIDKAGKNIVTLPADGLHFTRTIAIGPNYRTSQLITGGREQVDTLMKDKLYVSVGSSCDVCVEDTWKRAAILEADPAGRFTAEFAGGLRNSVFFTFHPLTGEIWATEMGRDGLGDNLPPDEINIVKVAGPEHKFGARRYGWPFCYGNKIADTKFNPDKIARVDIPTDCGQTEPATIELPAHSAPLGLVFIKNPSTSTFKWPSEWQNDLLVAYHGSWNRSEPTGYKIVKFKVDKNGKVSGTEDFISGWLKDGKVSGRPVDLKFGPDGALYISDDASGIIYRVVPR